MTEDEKQDEKKPRYAPGGKPMADALVGAIGSLGIELWQSEGETPEYQAAKAELASDPEKAMLMGYLTGFETALHVALCGGDSEQMVTVLAMAMDQSIHEGETPFYGIAEDAIATIKTAMLVQTLKEGGEVNGFTGFVVENPDTKSPEELNAEIRLGIAGVMAKVMPKKEKDDA